MSDSDESSLDESSCISSEFNVSDECESSLDGGSSSGSDYESEISIDEVKPKKAESKKRPAQGKVTNKSLQSISKKSKEASPKQEGKKTIAAKRTSPLYPKSKADTSPSVVVPTSRNLQGKVLQPTQGLREYRKLPNNQQEDPKNAMLSMEDQERRRANISAMLSGDLEVKRHALMPTLLSVDQDTAVLRRPFRSPYPNAPAGVSESLRQALMARKHFVPFGSGKNFVPQKVHIPEVIQSTRPPAVEQHVTLPAGIEELILWTSADGSSHVKVDNALTRFLRPHQREGVQFLFECVTGLREHDGFGSILADDMGLGKTLQGITLLWTLLNSGHPELGGKPIARKVVICCPTSLVPNWDSECIKWLNGRVNTMPICDASRDEVIDSLVQFTSPKHPSQVLIISYETFRIHAEKFQKSGTCDLLICDEAHRLKNDQTLTNKALGSMHCKRRILLSGTPLQNQLQEFYSMVNFCNPGVLGSPSEFRKMYERPILAGREPDATDDMRELSKERSSILSSFVNGFILRRTNDLLSKHLPPKVIEIVCCKMTPFQFDLYSHYVQSRSVTNLFTKTGSSALSAITTIRKLLNHPKLIYDMVQSAKRSSKKQQTGFESCNDLLHADLFEGARGSRASLPQGWEDFSGKFAVVSRMLALLRSNTKDRVVIVSNFTQTLDLFTILCKEKRYPFLRLDGSISLSKREKMVKSFNDPKSDQFIFLLSSKAGGCGLNLIGGNRLILFDMSWNPADDKQAAARVWRDGQQKKVYVYKLMTTGTIEEKIFQRQLNKEGLQSVVDGGHDDSAQAETNLMSFDQLRDLFTYDPNTLSTTFEHMVLEKEEDMETEMSKAGPVSRRQQGSPKEDNLADWGLHSDPTTVPDECMQICAEKDVSFIFSCQVDGKHVPPERPILGSKAAKLNCPQTIVDKGKPVSIISDSEDNE